MATSLVIFLFYFCSLPLSSLSQKQISLTLHQPIVDDPFRQMAEASLLRAHNLKNPSKRNDKHHKNHPSLGSIPLIPHSYGGYSVSLSFGTPPQTIPFVFDTGSDLAWAPCTHSYVCKNCSFPNPSGLEPVFFPKASSSARLVGCKNPKCIWIHSAQNLASRCNNASSSSRICPAYFLMYGMGSTGGVLLEETFVLPGKNVTRFAFGCSVFSSQQPAAGIAGFGRGLASIPSQLHLERFSYCLASRNYDDVAGKAGSIFLGGNPEDSHDNVSFTSFVNNPAAKPNTPFSVYYYIEIIRIVVGGNKVKIPPGVFLPGSDGNGGVIVDSGSTFTFMESGIFKLLIASFEESIAGRYNRSKSVEKATGLGLCYLLPDENVLRLPSLMLVFRGGAKMHIPIENYFAFVSDAEAGATCLTVVTDSENKFNGIIGPAIILGAFQQQNYHFMFDLQRQRFGFRREKCVGGA